MNKNKNFLRFMGYREHSFVVTTNFVHDSGHADANTINLANETNGSGFGNIILPGTAGTDLIVTVTADGAEASARGTQYTIDASTGAAFAAGGTTPPNTAAVEEYVPASTALNVKDITTS